VSVAADGLDVVLVALELAAVPAVDSSIVSDCSGLVAHPLVVTHASTATRRSQREWRLAPTSRS
jgi:hypothetical protein